MHLRSVFLALAAGMLASPPALADEAPQVADIEELDLAELLGSVSAASRVPERLLEAPAAVTVLDAEDIRHSGARTIPDLLRRVPGLQVTQTSAGNYLVTARGLGGLRGQSVAVMLDGVPMNRLFDGEVDWSAIPVTVDGLARVEVVRGPLSAIYGQSASAGVIALTSARASAGDGSALTSFGGVDVSGAPMLGAAVRLGAGERLKYDLALNGSRTPTLGGRSGAALAGENRAGSLLRAEYAASESSSLSLQLGASWSERSQRDHLVTSGEPEQGNLLLGALRYAYRPTQSALRSVEVWSTATSRRLSAAPGASGLSYDGTRAQALALGLDVNGDPLPWLHVSAGGGYGFERVTSPLLEEEERDRLRSTFHLYLDPTIEIRDQLHVQWALRWDEPAFAPELANSPVRPPFWSSFSQRLTFLYHWSSGSVRLSGGNANQMPRALEYYGRYEGPGGGLEGNRDLVAQGLQIVELGGNFAIAERWVLRPTLHLTSATRLLVEAPGADGTVRHTEETSPRWLTGAEVEADWHPSGDTTLELSGTYRELLTPQAPPGQTLAAPGTASRFTFGLHLRQRVDEGTSLGVGATFASARHWQAQAGIPAEPLRTEVGAGATLEGVLWRQLTERHPLHAFLRGQLHLPDEPESPYANAGRPGSYVLVGVEWRQL